MNPYHQRIEQLFGLLALANAADSDQAEPWQHIDDASQRNGFYGHIHNAIVAIAGQRIVDYWSETNEIDLNLADRN